MYPISALIIANIIWGAASPIFKLSLTSIPPFVLAFIRFFLGSFLLLPFCLKYWRDLDSRLLGWVCLGGLFGITINIAFFFLGLQRTQSINAPIIASSQPLFLYLFALLFLKEAPKSRVILGILISFTGVLIILFSPFLSNHNLNFFKELSAFEGNLFLLLATLGSVGHTLIFKKILNQISALQATYISFLVGALTFFPLMLFELNHWSFTDLNSLGWLGIVFGVIFSSTIAYLFFNYGVSKIPAQEVGVFSYIDPIAAILLAWLLLQEIPTFYFYLGCFLVFGGIFIAEKRIHYHPLFKIRSLKKPFFTKTKY
jgi:drug/metabolite transporter (DMT)-like permease